MIHLSRRSRRINSTNLPDGYLENLTPVVSPDASSLNLGSQSNPITPIGSVRVSLVQLFGSKSEKSHDVTMTAQQTFEVYIYKL